MTAPVEKTAPPPGSVSKATLERLFAIFRFRSSWATHPATPRLLMALLAVVWTLLLSSGAQFNPNEFQVGDIAPRTIRSPTQLVIEDVEGTEQARKKAADAVLPIIDYLENLPQTLQQKSSEALAAMRQATAASEELRIQVEQLLRKPIDDETFRAMFEARNDLQFEQNLRDVIGILSQMRIAAEPKTWTAAFPNGVILRSGTDTDKDPPKLLPENYRTILSVAEARTYLADRIQSSFAQASPKQRRVLTLLSKHLVQANLLPNPVETEKAQLAAQAAVKPVYFQLKPGEVIVRSGERISENHAKQLLGLYQQQARYQEHVGTVAKALLLLLAVFILTPYSRKPAWRNMGHPQDLLLLLIISSLILIIIQTGRNLAEPFILAAQNLPRETILLAMPFATASMIFRLFFRPRNAVQIAVLFALTLSLFVEPMLLILPYSLLAGLTGIQFLKHSKRRSQFYQAGLMVALVQGSVWLLYCLIETKITQPEMWRALPFALIGGFIASVLTSTLMPLCEWIGRYVSEVRLLELTQDDQPLLKWLHLNAPGTYAHSLSVARLAETAAERIGADELLARVGAYYHDIGKGYWPSYFVENQRAQNPHDKLKPQLSSRVIIAHVTHGAELARKNNLPPVIIDFILEHHGTSRVEYFYHQARGGRDDEKDTSAVDDQQFRYPGPKPRSKESALVMLADVVESATRTLDNPTADRIASFVSRLIEKVYADDQLAESPLTMRDLNVAKAAFTDVLTGMYHHRIDYPLGLKPSSKTAEP